MAEDITAIVNSMLNNAEVYQTMGLHVEALDTYEQILADHAALDAKTKKTVEDNIALLKQNEDPHSTEQDDIADIEPFLDIADIAPLLDNASVYQTMGLHVEALDIYEQILADHARLDAETKKTVEDNIILLKHTIGEKKREKDPQTAEQDDEAIEPLPEELSNIKESLFRTDTQFDDTDIAPILDNASELMAIKAEVKKYIREAKLYQNQDLLSESQDKYMAALKLLESNDAIKGKKNLVTIIESKLKSMDSGNKDEVGIDNELAEAEKLLSGLNEGTEELVLGAKVKKGAKKKDKDTRTATPLETAVALMNDSQFEDALIRLKELMDDEAYRVEAAGKLLECQTAVSSAGKAVDQLEAWLAEDLFKPEQLDVIRDILSKILESRGIIKIATRVVAAHQVGTQPPAPNGSAAAYDIPAPYHSGETGLDDKQFEFTDDEYSDIIDTIDIKAPSEDDLEENPDGEYTEFDFIDNINKTDEPLPSYISGDEKQDYDEFDVVDSVK
ncbi:hypothetical protein QUF90_07140 [Desulfococcaceae bacterium HSG9]|nr:hypothetical protein [Desulfococcaceae bacterium HSG9]